MIILIFKSLKAFFVEKKVLTVMLVLSICIGILIYFLTTSNLLRDKDEWASYINFSVTGLSQVEEIEGILSENNKHLQYLDITTNATLSDKSILVGASEYIISCSLSDPNLERVKYLSDPVSREGEERYIIFSNVGSNFFVDCKCGDYIYLAGEKFLHVADGAINFPTLVTGTISREAFMDIFGGETDKSFDVYAYYDIDISEKKLNTMSKELSDMGIEAQVNVYEKLSLSKILIRYREGIVLVSLAISIIMYGHYVDSRLRDYSVLRISGIGSKILKRMYILESITLFTLSYMVMAALWYLVIIFVLHTGTYNYGKICITGYVVLLLMYTLVNIPYLKRLSSKSTMELYRKSRRIG